VSLQAVNDVCGEARAGCGRGGLAVPFVRLSLTSRTPRIRRHERRHPGPRESMRSGLDYWRRGEHVADVERLASLSRRPSRACTGPHGRGMGRADPELAAKLEVGEAASAR
jgi:hypothetical protein